MRKKFRKFIQYSYWTILLSNAASTIMFYQLNLRLKKKEPDSSLFQILHTKIDFCHLSNQYRVHITKVQMWRHYSRVRNTVEGKNRDLRLKVGHYIEPGGTLLTYHHSLLRWSCPAVRPQWDSGPDCAWPFPTPLSLYFRRHLCQKGWRPLGTLKQANNFFLINKRIDYSFWRFILCLFFYISISQKEMDMKRFYFI